MFAGPRGLRNLSPLLAGHPQGEGDQEGGQGGAGGHPQIRHGEQAQQRRHRHVSPVPDQRLQPGAELKRAGDGSQTDSVHPIGLGSSPKVWTTPPSVSPLKAALSPTINPKEPLPHCEGGTAHSNDGKHWGC